MSLNANDKKELKREAYSITTREEQRMAIQLSKDGSSIEENQRSFYDVNAAQQENLKIVKMLQNADELQLSKEAQSDIKIAARRYANFLFMNLEKEGGESDSPLMAGIKSKLAIYEKLLDFKATDKDSIYASAESASRKCQQILDDCDTYLSRGKYFFLWRRKRYEDVSRLRARLENEKQILDRMGEVGYKKKYDDVLQTGDRLSGLLNKRALSGRIKRKTIRDENEPLKNKAMNASSSYAQKEDNIKKAIRKSGLSAEYSFIKAASSMAILNGYTNEQALEYYERLIRDESDTSITEEDKEKKIKDIEKYFDSILSFDLNTLTFEKTEDLFGDKFEKCFALCNAAVCFDLVQGEYDSLVKKDAGAQGKYTPEQVAELQTKTECLKKVSMVYKKVISIMKRGNGLYTDLNVVWTTNYQSLKQKLDQNFGPEINALTEKEKEERAVAEDLCAIREALEDEKTGKLLFGREMDINGLFMAEFKKVCDRTGQLHLYMEKETELAKEKYKTETEADYRNKEEKCKEAIQKEKERAENTEAKKKDLKDKKAKGIEDAKKYREAQLKRDKEENDQALKDYNNALLSSKFALVELNKKQNLNDPEKELARTHQSKIALLVHNRQTDQKVYARNYVDMNIKKKVGYAVMKDLSEFYPMMEALTSDEKEVVDERKAKKQFSEMVEKYGKSKDDRLSVLTELSEKLLQHAEGLDLKKLLSEDIVQNMDQFETMAGMVQGMKSLMKKNPEFTGSEEFQKQFAKLSAATNLFRVKKQLLLDPAWKAAPPVDLTGYPEKKEGFAKAHFRRMLMVERVLEENFVRLHAPEHIKELKPLKISDSPMAKADLQYAMRLSNVPENKEEREEGQKKEKEKLLAQYEKLKAERAELEALYEKETKAYDKPRLRQRIKEKNVLCEHLAKKMKKEMAEDPSERIADALRLIEQERFRVPMDFNNVDFDHIPEKKEGTIEEAIGSFLVDGPKEVAPQSLMMKKMGYQKFKEWVDEYRVKQLKKERLAGKIKGHENGSIPQHIIFQEDLDRLTYYFYGSYHFHRTDAEMREQYEALNFAYSKDAWLYEEDPEAIAYMDGEMKEMIFRMHNQQADVGRRNAYGGAAKLYMMTPADRLMAVNVYQKMDMQAGANVTNVDTDENYADYLEYLDKNDTEGSLVLDDEGTRLSGNLTYLLMPVNSGLAYFGVNDIHMLSPEMQQEYDKIRNDYITEYKNKNNNKKPSKEEIFTNFLLKYPEAWNDKKFFYNKPLKDETAEAMRKGKLKMDVNSLWSKDVPVSLFRHDSFEPLTKEQIDNYEKEYDKQGFGSLKSFLQNANNGFQDKKPTQILKENGWTA
ncbi:MAG: hypothetical protein IJT05_09670 [Lachnospiraceae bacterium]|nr:hypothetical protein [Lachnospiraceae bacterium]